MKIYTKSGDRGKTGVIGRERLLKSHPRVCAYGSVDEVNSWVGCLLAELPDDTFSQLKEELHLMQILLFDLGTDLATIKDAKPYILGEAELKWIENLIDTYQEKVPVIEKFILPGGSVISSHFQIARTVIRRAEREVTELLVADEINNYAYKIINRLSDLFFVWGRYVSMVEGKNEDFYERAGKVFL